MGDNNTGIDGTWHPDPTGRHHQRFWDGTAWTDRVNDAGVIGSDPLLATPPPTPAPTGPAPTAPVPTPPPTSGPAGTDLLTVPTVVMEMPPSRRRGEFEVHLPVLAEDQRPLGWVRYARQVPNRWNSGRVIRFAELYDVDSRPVVVARCEERTSHGTGPGDLSTTFFTFSVADPTGTYLAERSKLTRFGSTTLRLSNGYGVEVMTLSFGAHRARHQIAPTTVAMGGHPVAQVTPLGRRATGAPGEAWMRLDRTALPAGPPTLLALAAPLLLVTYIT